MTKHKAKMIALATITMDYSRNVREQNAESYENVSLDNDIALVGQQDAVTVERVGDKLYPIKGFRRLTSMNRLALAGVIDPKTGKPFEMVEAIIVEGLTEAERYDLLLDHGQRKGLTKVELQNALERGFASFQTEEFIATKLYSLLEMHYPPSRKVEDNAKDKLNYYRGVIQTAKAVWNAPTVLHDAWIAKLRNQQKWPLKAEMVELVTVFQKERDADKTCQINKSNPGPQFLEKWEKLKAKYAEAQANGEKAKPSSMMNRTQTEDAKKTVDSLFAKAIIAVILRDIPGEKLAELDKELVALEATMTEEQKARVLAIIA